MNTKFIVMCVFFSGDCWGGARFLTGYPGCSGVKNGLLTQNAVSHIPIYTMFDLTEIWAALVLDKIPNMGIEWEKNIVPFEVSNTGYN